MKNKKANLAGPTGSGPRTIVGKRRSRRNALRHGFYADEILLPNENHELFSQLIEQLRDEWRPEGVLEDYHVFVIGASIWRRLRMLKAEAAEIGRVAQFVHIDRMQQQHLAAEACNSDQALLSDTLNPFALHRGIEVLRTLRAEFETRGFHEQDLSTLRRLYGEDMELGFSGDYAAAVSAFAASHTGPEPPATPIAAERILKAIDSEISRLETLLNDANEVERTRAEFAARSALVPPPEVLNRLVRCEAHCDRVLLRATRELQRLQRARRCGTAEDE